MTRKVMRQNYLVYEYEKITKKKRILTKFSLGNKVTIRGERLIFTAKSVDDNLGITLKNYQRKAKFLCKVYSSRHENGFHFSNRLMEENFSDMDARTSPYGPCTTTPIPVVPSSLKIAPSKLTLTKRGVGLDHRIRLLWTAEEFDEDTGLALIKSARIYLSIKGEGLIFTAKSFDDYLGIIFKNY